MAALGPRVEAALASAVSAGIDGVSGSCANMLKHRAALWTFVTHADVEPTNNHAEREIRAFVLWRERSYGAARQPVRRARDDHRAHRAQAEQERPPLPDRLLPTIETYIDGTLVSGLVETATRRGTSTTSGSDRTGSRA